MAENKGSAKEPTIMQIIEGNLLDIKEGVCGHQVNCKSVMGRGLALQIRQKYPVVYDEYIKKEPKVLGDAQFIEVSKDPHLVIANLFGQLDCGRDKCYTDYGAVSSYMSKFAQYCRVNKLQGYLPYQIACGLACGDWSIVLPIIQQEYEEVILVKLGDKSATN